MGASKNQAEVGRGKAFMSEEAAALHPALERHYSIEEISALWGFSRQTARRIFDKEAGVLRYGRGDSSRRRGYQTLRIPESVLVRVHGRLRGQSG